MTSNPNDTTNEETEPLADEEDDDFNGIPGQIQYPDREVDAERAGEWVAGKADSLYPDDEDGERVGWENPADRSGEVEDPDDEESKADE